MNFWLLVNLVYQHPVSLLCPYIIMYITKT